MIYVVVPCWGPRQADLDMLMPSLRGCKVVVPTDSQNPVHDGPYDILDRGNDLNIANWWNVGLEYVSKMDGGEHEVLLLGSDVGIDNRTVRKLSLALRRYDLAMVGPDWRRVVRNGIDIRRETSWKPWYFRIPGVCMMVAGEKQLRCDPQFRWYYADDDFENQARVNGGTGLVGGLTIQHHAGTPLDPIRQQYANEDLPKFIVKWGYDPNGQGPQW